MNKIDEYLDSHREAFEADLCEFLKIPSVSADSKRRTDVRRAAEWVAARLEGIGLVAELIETPGHPVVYAESPAVPGAPTALVYGHYDVQPPDPLDEWVTPPFEPTVRDGNIYARGATDDKGQLFTHLASVQAWMATALKLPIQVKYLIEGEEEVGSENLEAFIAENIERLACDCIVISDTSQFGPGQPAITYGLRGIAYYELRLRGPRQDLHSGTFGGGVINPAVVLTQMLSALFDERGRVAVPQFYDDVESLGEAEREQLQALPFNELHFMEQLGVEGLGGENGYSTLERRWVRPSCDINGLWSGYQGEGAKTVLPARAGAKLSFRLVPRQDPKKISADLRSFFESLLPAGITMELIEFHSGPGIVVSLDSPFIRAAAQAVDDGFGRSPVMIREGGSIPVVTTFHERLEADILLLGWGLSDDNTHSPNEKFCLADFHRGTKASAHLWRRLADLGDLKEKKDIDAR